RARARRVPRRVPAALPLRHRRDRARALGRPCPRARCPRPARAAAVADDRRGGARRPPPGALSPRRRPHAVARAHEVRGHVDLAAVDGEVPVAHELAGLGARGRKPEPVGDVVEPPLEELQQHVAGDTLAPVGEVEVAAELPLEQTVDAPELLLLAELDRVLRELRPRLAVLAGRIIAPLDGALVRVAPLALQKQLEPLPPAEAADRARVPCHWLPPHTRRRLGGRQPLCGIGVTSLMTVTVNPTAWRLRSADSRPAPGPFTNTCTWRMPSSAALRAAASAATCAANGVPLRAPLKPTEPAVAQTTTFPCGSVMVTTVLLKVEWMCTTPSLTSRFTFLRRIGVGGGVSGAAAFAAAGSACFAMRSPHPFGGGGFLPAIVRRGPLRVRALVCVRWPRT